MGALISGFTAARKYFLTMTKTLTFRDVALCDVLLLQKHFNRYKGRICDFSAGNAVFWREHYGISFYEDSHSLILRFDDMDDTVCYGYPISKDAHALIECLIRESEDKEICVSLMTRDELDALCQDFCVKQIMHSEDWDDYLYNKEDIVTLRGRRYSGQRNHINKFKKLYDNWCFERIDSSNTDKAKEFFERFFTSIGKPTDVSEEERVQLREQLENFESYSQLGGILSVNGQVIGASIGEQVGDTLIIHTEKADVSFEGAYPMLVNCFAREFATDDSCLFINREEDCGEEGLRISKRSYHPVQMIEKYAAIVSLN